MKASVSRGFTLYSKVTLRTTFVGDGQTFGKDRFDLNSDYPDSSLQPR
jgi:hypothetical protein